MKYIINKEAIVVFHNGSPVRVEKTDKRYPLIIEVFDLPEDEQDDALQTALEPQKAAAIAINGVDGFEVVDGSVWYDGEKLPKVLSDKVISIAAEGLPLENFELFWERLSNNPSSSSVTELLDFLEYKELPITEDGCFLAYKAVNSDYYSCHGNPDTKVIQGTVDDSGRIYNGVGEVIEVRRRDVNDDRNVHCSWGLHVGSLDYARSFGETLLIVKVDPSDVVSVPTDCACQKCRVSKYKVIGDFVEEIVTPVTDASGDTVSTSKAKELDKFTQRVAQYLERKEDEGFDELTIRQIQNSFSPEYPSKEKVINAVQELGYLFRDNNGVVVVELW